MMSRGLVADKSAPGVAPASNRPAMPANRPRGRVASVPGSRVLPLVVSLGLLSVVMGIFPGRAASCVPVKILLGGSSGADITGQTESRYVGQQTVLYASYTLPSGVSVSSQTWSVGGTTVGGFTSRSSGGYTGTALNQQSATLYWLAAGNSLSVSFTLDLSNGSSSSASATFNLAGPTSPYVTTALGNWRISSAPNLQLGNPDLASDYGITFNGSAASPPGDAGTYEWAQILSTYEWDRTSGSTTSKCTALNVPGLDSRFPYAEGPNGVNDSPYVPLESPYSRETLTFGAAMYFMWNPGTSLSDIPVPLGYVSWQAYGDATLSNGNWSVQPDSNRSALAFQASTSARPFWAGVFNGSVNCP